MVKIPTMAIVWWESPGFHDTTEPLLLDQAVEFARNRSQEGYDAFVYKLTETHHFKAGK